MLCVDVCKRLGVIEDFLHHESISVDFSSSNSVYHLRTQSTPIADHLRQVKQLKNLLRKPLIAYFAGR